MKNWLIIICSLLLSSTAFGQSGIGSYVTHNGPQTISEGTFEVVYSESLYFGPGADIQLDGDLIVYARNIWIAPTARIHGSGTLTLHSPSTNPMYTGWPEEPTIVDGNNSTHAVDVTIVLNNSMGLMLENIEEGDLDDATLPSGSKSAALRISKSIDLAVNGANVYLNGNDFELGTVSDILNAGRERMVVTGDRVDGHLIKNYAGLGVFHFPVGIAAGDYTPATLTPSTSGRQVYVTVTSYVESNIDFDIADIDLGMDRVWNIYADEALEMTYRLQHNMATNGVAYVDANAQVIQNADGGNWIGDVTIFDGEGIHTREDIETIAGNTLTGTWFTKQSFSGPTANDDGPIDITYGRSTDEIPSINVLDNDQPGSSAIVVESVRIVTPPTNGRVVVNSDGSITYIPNGGYIGEDRFEYEITDENGLTSTAWVTVNVLPRDLFIPNVFTPNGDGFNDYFEIVGIEAFDRIHLVVINRWGNEVYRNTDYRNTWDGRGLNDGTYFYIIEAQRGGQTRVFKGDVLIKRN